jgi:hypothetical protein
VYLIPPEWNARKATWQGGNPHMASVLAIDEHLLGFTQETMYALDRRSVELFPWFSDEDRATAFLAVDAIHGRGEPRPVSLQPFPETMKAMTLGELLRSVRSLDEFRREQRSDTDGSPGSSYMRLTAAVNIAEVEVEHRRQPGYDRLEAYVNAEFGPMDYQNLCRLRGRICTTRNCGTSVADALTLAEAANALACPGGVARTSTTPPNQSNGGSGATNETDELDPFDRLAPSRRIAWGQYQDALRRNPEFGENPKDRDVYTWLAEHDEAELPEFSTWSKYVRAARGAKGAQKNTPRAGREGRSVAKPGDL